MSEKGANVIDFISKREHLDTMSDAEVIDELMASLLHPGVTKHDSAVLADTILEYTGVKGTTATVLRQAWRDRIVRIEQATAALSDTAYDELVDRSSDTYDEGFAALVDALTSTRDQRDVELQRHALMRLTHLRVAALRVESRDTEPWTVLAGLLSKET